MTSTARGDSVSFRHSLRFKLPLSILTVFLLILSISTVYILHQADSVISWAKSSRIRDTAAYVGNAVSLQLQRAGKDMKLVAGLPNVLQGIELAPAEGASPAQTMERAALAAMFNRVRWPTSITTPSGC